MTVELIGCFDDYPRPSSAIHLEVKINVDEDYLFIDIGEDGSVRVMNHRQLRSLQVGENAVVLIPQSFNPEHSSTHYVRVTADEAAVMGGE